MLFHCRALTEIIEWDKQMRILSKSEIDVSTTIFNNEHIVITPVRAHAADLNKYSPKCTYRSIDVHTLKPTLYAVRRDKEKKKGRKMKRVEK